MSFHRRQRFPLPVWSLGLAVAYGCAGAAPQQRHRKLTEELEREPSFVPASSAEAPRPSGQLEREDFVRSVLERNPSIAAAREAWRAALAQVPQARAVPDPMLEYAFAPLSIGARNGEYGQSITVRQTLPWPGTLAFSGDVALADAEARREDYRAARLDLALMASQLFDAYYAVERGIEVIEHHAQLMAEIGDVAVAQYEAGRGPAEGPIRAELEAALVERQRLELRTRRGVLVAQMNALLHRDPASPLPPPPNHLDDRIEGGTTVPQEARTLQDEAVSRRPELHASRVLVRGRASAIRGAQRAFFPNLGWMTSYSTMWPMPQHRWMVGISIDVPLEIRARRAAVEQATAQHRQAEYEAAARELEVRSEVEQARLRIEEARAALVLYRDRLLPAARQQIETALTAYTTGMGGLELVLEAERALRELELGHEDASTELHRRHAELSRALGRVPGLAAEEVQ